MISAVPLETGLPQGPLQQSIRIKGSTLATDRRDPSLAHVRTLDFSPCRLAIEARHTDLRLSDELVDSYRLRYVPAKPGTRSFDTACWCYLAKQEAHLITFGAALLTKKDQGSDAEYGLLYYEHEIQHSLSTQRDLVALRADLKDAGVTFGLCNLAEDARIENLARIRLSRSFGWLTFESPGTGMSADALLFQIIQADGDMALVRPRHRGTPALSVLSRVEVYYGRFINAAATADLIPILREWVQEFGNPPDSGNGDLASGAAVQAGELSLADLLGEDDDGTPIGSQPDKTGAVVVTEVGNHDFFQGESHFDLDHELVDAIAAQLRKALQSGVRKVRSATPSKRIAIRAYLRGSERIFRRHEKSRAGVRPRIRVFLDLSASMRVAVRWGLHFVAALNALAAAGLVDAVLILTKIDGSRKACHQALILPVPTAALERLSADGAAEGFADALDATAHLLEVGDLVFGYTDGDIRDRPVDKAFWHSRGIFSTGLYAGEDQGELLEKWFDGSVCRNEPEDLITAVAELLRDRR